MASVLGVIEFYPNRFTLDWYLFMLRVLGWWSWQNNIIWKRKSDETEVPFQIFSSPWLCFEILFLISQWDQRGGHLKRMCLGLSRECKYVSLSLSHEFIVRTLPSILTVQVKMQVKCPSKSARVKGWSTFQRSGQNLHLPSRIWG